MLDDPTMMTALARYQVVSTYLAMEPKRGQKARLRDDLAKRDWRLEDGSPLKLTSGETIRRWVRRYQRDGLPGLVDKVRDKRGVTVLSDELIERACSLKREVPERSLDKLITIMEELKMVEPGLVRRSTLHRALQAAGLSARKPRPASATDLDRFEAERPNDLWQSDMLEGPYLPDPKHLGKKRKTYLYAFLDDHSRLLLHGRFSFKGDLPALELVFRRCLQKYGVCRRVYYDNGKTYRSTHMKQVVAMLGIHGMVFTTPYRPEGHGKIEAFNRFITSNFLAELKASTITTLDELNEAFLAWSDLEYNRRCHSETGMTPHDRWRAGLSDVRYADEESLRQAFLWKEKRTPDKSGVFSLFGTKYQAGPGLAKRSIEVRYDPEALAEVEVWRQGAFVERVRPLEIGPHRRPRPAQPEVELAQPTTPTADYLGHLVKKRRAEGFIEPTPQQLAEHEAQQRRQADDAIIRALGDALHDDVFDEATARGFLNRYGPFDADQSATVVERICNDDSNARHISVYLEAIRTELAAGGSHE